MGRYKSLAGLTEIFPLTCTSPVWGQHPVLSHPEPPEGSPWGVAAVWWLLDGRHFFSSLSSLSIHQLTIHGGWWLWHPLFTDKAGNLPFLKFQKKLLSSTTEGKWIFKNTYTYCVYIWILYMDTVYQYINMTLTLCIYIYMEYNSFTNTSLCRPGSVNLVWEEGMSRRITRLCEKKCTP